MGAWSHEPFGNDTACDWAYGLIESQDLSYIESALDAIILNGSDYLEADFAEEAIAAIAVLAKILGKDIQSDSYTEEINKWVASITDQPSSVLLEKALIAIELILSEESELFELWQDSDDADEWLSSMTSLKSMMAS